MTIRHHIRILIKRLQLINLGDESISIKGDDVGRLTLPATICLSIVVPQMVCLVHMVARVGSVAKGSLRDVLFRRLAACIISLSLELVVRAIGSLLHLLLMVAIPLHLF